MQVRPPRRNNERAQSGEDSGQAVFRGEGRQVSPGLPDKDLTYRHRRHIKTFEASPDWPSLGRAYLAVQLGFSSSRAASGRRGGRPGILRRPSRRELRVTRGAELTQILKLVPLGCRGLSRCQSGSADEAGARADTSGGTRQRWVDKERSEECSAIGEALVR